jgi:hypothetical protein
VNPSIRRCENIRGKVDADNCAIKHKCPKCGCDPLDSTELHNLSDKGTEASKLSAESQSESIQNYPIVEELSVFWKLVRDYVRRFLEIDHGKEESMEEKKNSKTTSGPAFMTEACEHLFISERCKPLGVNGIPNRA